MIWVYITEGADEQRLIYVVGFYGPSGFQEDSRHGHQDAARARVSYLNGGASDVAEAIPPAR